MDVNGDPDYQSGSSFGNSVQHGYPGGNQNDEWVVVIANLNNELAFSVLGNGSDQFQLRKIGFTLSTLTNDEVLRLQGYLVWDMINRGLITSGQIGDYLPVAHPYFAAPPTNAGGSTSSVTVQFPVVTVTLNGLQPGSEVIIVEAGTANIIAHEESSGTSFNFNPTSNYDVKIYRVGFKYFSLVNVVAPSQNVSIPISQFSNSSNYQDPI
ncbi:MAG: hypothetical protein AAFW67_13755 [Cyanobacteria bacterium J06638_38]